MTYIKLYKSPVKSLRLILLTLPFVACGIFVLLKTDSSKTICISGILLFGLGLLMGLFNMFDRRPQIIINKIGIWDRTMNQDLINWEYIKDVIQPIDISGQSFIPLIVDEQFIRRKKNYQWAINLSKSYGAKDINLNISYIKLNIERFMTLLNILQTVEIESRDEAIEMYKDRIIP